MSAMTRIAILTGICLGLTASTWGRLGLRAADERAGEPARELVAANESDTVRTRRLGTLTVYPWDISPDARGVIVHDWGAMELAVRDLRTGQLRRVTEGAGPDASGDYAWAGRGVYSPDGGRIAHAWVDEGCGRAVRVVELASGESRSVLPCTDDLDYYSPWDWTPDGTGLLVVLGLDDGSSRMATLDVEGGTLREIATFPEGRDFTRPRYSADGRFVVYSAERAGSSGVDLFSVPVEGGTERPLTRDSGDEYLFGWESGGEAMVFYRTDGLDSGVYRVAFRQGRTVGEPQLVRRNVWHATPLGSTSDGFAYLVPVEQRQVQTASVDLEDGGQLTAFAPVEDPSVGSSSGGAWSADGRSLAYVRRSEGDARLVVLGVEDGESREYPFPLDGGGMLLEWALDGRALLAYGLDGELGWGVFRIDLRSGDATALLLERHADLGSDWRTLSFSPDRRRLVAGGTGPAEDEIRVYDLETGTSTVVTRADRVWRTAVSPDGTRVAFWIGTEPATLHVVSMRGGTAERVPVDPVSIPWGLAWTPDGRHLAWASQGALRRVPVAGGAPAVIAEDLTCSTGYFHLRFSPDGRRVSCTGGSWRGEVWLLETGEATSR